MIIFIVIIIFASMVVAAIFKIKNTSRLKSQYDRTLLGTDKRAALNAGRAYYSSLRGKSLTIYDEQAIANDISTMKSMQ